MTQKYVSVFILFLPGCLPIFLHYFAIACKFTHASIPDTHSRAWVTPIAQCIKVHAYDTRWRPDSSRHIFTFFFIISSQSMCVCWLSGGSAASNASARVCVFGIRVFQFNGLKHLESNIFLYIISVNSLSIFFRLTTTTSPSGWTHFISGQRIRSFS